MPRLRETVDLDAKVHKHMSKGMAVLPSRPQQVLCTI